MNVYLAMKHPEHPYQRGAHTEAGTVEKVFADKKEAQYFVDEKNKRAAYSYWSVKAKKVDGNTQGEAVDRLLNRKVVNVLAATVRTYAAWIREEGERNNTCTFHVLGEVCGYCECKRKPSNEHSA